MATINTSLNDKLIAQNALEAFVADMESLSLFTTNYSAEVVRRGATVEVPLVANLTATTFNQDYALTDGTLDHVTVSIDQHKIVGVSISDTEYSKSSVADVTKFSYQAGKALAQAVLTSVYGLFVTTASSAAQYTATITGASTFNITSARALRKALAAEKVPNTDRALILNSTLYDSLLSSDNLLQAQQFGARDAIAEARVPRVLGMNCYESLVLPTNSISLSGLAVHPNSVALAVRALEPQAPSEYLSAQTITDPQTGLTIGVRRFYLPQTGRHHLSFEAVWGASRAITGAAKLVLGA